MTGSPRCMQMIIVSLLPLPTRSDSYCREESMVGLMTQFFLFQLFFVLAHH